MENNEVFENEVTDVMLDVESMLNGMIGGEQASELAEVISNDKLDDVSPEFVGQFPAGWDLEPPAGFEPNTNWAQKQIEAMKAAKKG